MYDPCIWRNFPVTCVTAISVTIVNQTEQNCNRNISVIVVATVVFSFLFCMLKQHCMQNQRWTTSGT